MSRSFKKNSGCVDRNPYMKNYANRKFRRLKYKFSDTANGKAYKKITCSWDICDWSWIYYSKSEYIKELEHTQKMWPNHPDYYEYKWYKYNGK